MYFKGKFHPTGMKISSLSGRLGRASRKFPLCRAPGRSYLGTLFRSGHPCSTGTNSDGNQAAKGCRDDWETGEGPARSASQNKDEQRYDHSPQTQERGKYWGGRGEESCSGSGTMLAQEQTQTNTFRLKLGESCYHPSEFWASFPMGIQKATKIVLGCSLIPHKVSSCSTSKVLSPSRKVLQHVLPRAQTQ